MIVSRWGCLASWEWGDDSSRGDDLASRMRSHSHPSLDAGVGRPFLHVVSVAHFSTSVPVTGAHLTKSVVSRSLPVLVATSQPPSNNTATRCFTDPKLLNLQPKTHHHHVRSLSEIPSQHAYSPVRSPNKNRGTPNKTPTNLRPGISITSSKLHTSQS